MANAHKAGTMAGHLGAAVITGYFLNEDLPNLPDKVFEGLEGEMKRVIAGEEAIWWNVKKAGITTADLFASLAIDNPSPDSIEEIASALEEGISQLRQSGHNVIFGSIAIRALKDHPDLASSQMIMGLCRLMLKFTTEHAGKGYYGKQIGWLYAHQVQKADRVEFPAYASIEQMVTVTLKELVETAPVKKQGFGGLWHLINHAAAITELELYGYPELADRALAAHHTHVELWRGLPDVSSELGHVVKAAHDPLEPAYWSDAFRRDEAKLTHRIKTLYGFYTLLRYVHNDQLAKKASQALLYLMA